jgi:hypothetical protein
MLVVPLLTNAKHPPAIVRVSANTLKWCVMIMILAPLIRAFRVLDVNTFLSHVTITTCVRMIPAALQDAFLLTKLVSITLLAPKILAILAPDVCLKL